MYNFIKAKDSADARVIAALAEEIWTEHYTPIIGAAQVEYILKNMHGFDNINAEILTGGLTYFIVYSGGEPAGYFAFKQAEDNIFISKLYLLNKMRKNGLGRAIINFIKTIYSDKKSIFLRANRNNVNALAAYKKLGFQISSTEDNNIGNGFINEDYVLTLNIFRANAT